MSRTVNPSPPVVLAALSCLCVAHLAVGSTVSAQQSFFKRGDANVDDRFDMSDALYVLERLFVSTEPLECEDSADVNDDGKVDLSDAVSATGYLFRGSSQPPPPHASCGVDPTEDSLGCPSFAPCETVTDLCLSQGALEELADELELSFGFSFCLPADVLSLPIESFEITVCPSESAVPECGILDTSGCPIVITSISPFLDLGEERVGLRIQGRVDDLPIVVTGGPFGTTATCLQDLHGEDDPDAPFSLELVIPLIVEEVEPGVREVVGTGDGAVENANIEIDSSGGLLCVLFEAVQGVFLDLILSPFEEAMSQLTSALPEQLVGMRICN